MANWLHRPVSECMATMTLREYELTLEYLQRKNRERTPEHLYLMQIARLIAGGNQPIEAFAIKWESSSPKPKDERTRESINAWKTAAGINGPRAQRKRKK